MGTWLNSDGLYVKFGTDDAASEQQGGWVCNYGPFASYILNLDLTTLTETETIQNDVLVIPKDSLILSVETITVVAAATGTAIDVGLIANDRSTTTDLNAGNANADPNGLLAALTATEMSEAGEYLKFWDTTSVPVASAALGGALLGEVLTVPTLITASRTDSTAFTAGRVIIKIDVIPNVTTGFGQVH
jgi:hypothetical protein